MIKVDNTLLIKALKERINHIKKDIDDKHIAVFKYTAMQERKIRDISRHIQELIELEES